MDNIRWNMITRLANMDYAPNADAGLDECDPNDFDMEDLDQVLRKLRINPDRYLTNRDKFNAIRKRLAKGGRVFL